MTKLSPNQTLRLLCIEQAVKKLPFSTKISINKHGNYAIYCSEPKFLIIGDIKTGLVEYRYEQGFNNSLISELIKVLSTKK